MRRVALAVVGVLSCAVTPDLARIDDGKHWRIINGEPASSLERNARVVRLAPKGGNLKGSNVAMAIAGGSRLAAGTIEIDLEGNGSERASFLGVAFNVADDKHYEAVYFRPFNFRAEDATHRGHAVQYVAWPEHTWERLRAQTPGVFESAIAPVPDPAGWFHARIDVGRKQVSVFVNGATTPCLVVERLSAPAPRPVALWVDSQDGAFANLKIAAAP